jgi:hypothetical protein
MYFTLFHLKQAEAHGVLSPDQAEHLWQDLCSQKAEEPTFKAQHVLYYFGAALMSVGLAALGFTLHFSVGPLAALLLVTGICAGLLYGASRLFRKSRQIVAGVLATTAVCCVPVMVVELGHMSPQSPGHIQSLAAGLALASALALYQRMKVPFLLLSVAVSGTALIQALAGSLDLAAGWEIGYGLILLVLGSVVDLRTRRTVQDHSFWLWACGGLLVWVEVLAKLDLHVESLMWVALNLAMLIISVVAGRRMLAALGALGLEATILWAAGRFDSSVAFAFVVLLAGSLLVFGGMRWPTLEKTVRRRLTTRE